MILFNHLASPLQTHVVDFIPTHFVTRTLQNNFVFHTKVFVHKYLQNNFVLITKYFVIVTNYFLQCSSINAAL